MGAALVPLRFHRDQTIDVEDWRIEDVSRAGSSSFDKLVDRW